ncbi:hypothetical protein EC919_112124 [Pseudomonas graminis]|nr:hypothetical protein EC919_112124 [Pseudomonas graminis]
MPANAICLCHPFRLTHRIRQQAGSCGSCARRPNPGKRRSTVGARLPANAICLCHPFRLTHCIRQQAGSYSSAQDAQTQNNANPRQGPAARSCARRPNPGQRRSTVGARLPANAICLCHPFRLTHCIRQQAGSYSSAQDAQTQNNANPRQGPAARSCARRPNPGQRRSTVGARLPANAICLCPPFRLTHCVRQQAGSCGSCARRPNPDQRRSTVGARLPANAICLCHPFRLTHRIRQQAGSCGSCARRPNPGQRRSTVGARLPANAICLCHPFRLTHCVRQQAGSCGNGGVSCSSVGRKVFRGQARSYGDLCSARDIRHAQYPVGAGLLANAVVQALQ